MVENGAITVRTVPDADPRSTSTCGPSTPWTARAACGGGTSELQDAYVQERLILPHEGFNRKVGSFAGQHISPAGEILELQDWERQSAAWLPTPDDRARVAELMLPHYEPGEFATWIAPPGIRHQRFAVEYDSRTILSQASASTAKSGR